MNSKNKDNPAITNSDSTTNNILNDIFSVWDIVVAFSLFLFCMFVFNKMYSFQEDQALHLNFIFTKVELHKLFTSLSHNSIMQWLVYVFGFGNKAIMYQALPFLLSIAFISKYFVIRWINMDFLIMHRLNNFNQSLLRILALLISFSFPVYTYLQIISQNLYRGLIPQCVWHNPTIVIAMPFAILFFWESYKLLISYSIKRIAIVFFLLLINFFTKPVFLMPCLPIFFLCFFLFEHNNNDEIFISLSKRKVLLTVLLVIPAALVVLFLYKKYFGDQGISLSFISTLKNHDNNYHFLSNVSFVMRRMFDISSSNQILLFFFVIIALLFRIFLLNIFYVFTLFIVCKKVLFQNLYAISIWIFGLFIALLATEVKYPASENFLWHMITCNMVLLVVGVNNLTYHVFNKDTKQNYIFTFAAFGGLCLQTYCGMLYLMNLLFRGVWY